jgi:hypothetical protein
LCALPPLLYEYIAAGPHTGVKRLGGDAVNCDRRSIATVEKEAGGAGRMPWSMHRGGTGARFKKILVG